MLLQCCCNAVAMPWALPPIKQALDLCRPRSLAQVPMVCFSPATPAWFWMARKNFRNDKTSKIHRTHSVAIQKLFLFKKHFKMSRENSCLRLESSWIGCSQGSKFVSNPPDQLHWNHWNQVIGWAARDHRRRNHRTVFKCINMYKQTSKNLIQTAILCLWIIHIFNVFLWWH